MTEELSYEQKSVILISNGWQTLWCKDNWVKREWLSRKSGNIDWAGFSTDQALQEVMRNLKSA